MKDIYELRSAYYKKNPDGHYFDPDTLKFFGERLSEMRVYKGTTRVIDSCGEEHETYKISKYSRKYPGGARRTYDYFDVNTLKDVMAF